MTAYCEVFFISEEIRLPQIYVVRVKILYILATNLCSRIDSSILCHVCLKSSIKSDL